jgi:hypothetical protein
MAIDLRDFDTSMIPLAGFALRGLRILCVHGKGSWARAPVLPAIASSGECVKALHDADVDASKSLHLFRSLDYTSRTCLIMDNIPFHKSAIE